MPTPSSPNPDPRSLALGCSALARAGQTLSTTTSPAQARAALRSVADQLSADANLATLINTDEVARKCREMAATPDDTATIGACRQIATQLARRASSLAAGVQPRTPATPPATKPAAAPADAALAAATDTAPAKPAGQETPTPAGEVRQASAAAAPPPPPPTPATAAAPPPQPKPAPEPEPVRAEPARAKPAPRVDPALVRRITIARTDIERQAVQAALEQGKRFAEPGDGTFIDTQANRRWAADMLPGSKHADAVSASSALRVGGAGGWRLPQPEELARLLENGGAEALEAVGVLPQSDALWLWTGSVRSRFLGFLKDAVAFHVRTGQKSPQSLKNANVCALLTRE